MSIARKILMGAAGGKKDSTYVDDVFSTYLWKGTGSAQKIENGLKLGNANAGNSVYFGGFGKSSDYLQMAHTTDLCFGNGDFTIECWAYAEKHDSWNAIIGNWNNGNPADGYALETVSGDLEFYWYNAAGSYTLVQGAAVPVGQWSHLCVCRSGNTLRVFVNGTMYGSGVSMTEGIRDGTTDFTIGGRVAGGGWWDGNITNLRVTKGQGLYTSNFTPSTEPFTTTSQGATASNVKLLCCNKDTVTGSTVTPGTITAFGTPTASNFGTGTGTDGEGGLTWIRRRNQATDHYLYDTASGATKYLASNDTMAQQTDAATLTTFNNNGFSVGTNGGVNGNGNDFVGWSFRNAPGLFDCIKFTGSGGTSSSPQSISHSLKSIPGMIIIKNITQASQWFVYHKSIGVDKFLQLNKTDAAVGYNGGFSNITNSSFNVFDSNSTNTNEFVAYVFAGGGSSAATARSVDFDGSGDYLSIPDSSDFEIDGTNFTLECWFKADDLSGNQAIAGQWELAGGTDRNFDFYLVGSTLYFENCRGSTNYSVSTTVRVGQWYHIAGVLDGTTLKLFVNGNLVGTTTVSGSANNSTANFGIGGYATGTVEEFNGKISNLRFVKGTAVYTSSFKPPTEPLANITNTKLLCCNNSSTTGSTVTPGTITANGDPTASTDSPFDDPAGFKFGEVGNQNIIKCGSYKGAGAAENHVHVGFEPSFVMVKGTSNTGGWRMFDSMRGISSGYGDATLQANTSGAEFDNWDQIDLTPTGFKLQANETNTNGGGYSYVYLCIRRPDPLVAKPVEAGTDVFSMDAPNSNTTGPIMESPFPVDFGLAKVPTATGTWYASARLIQGEFLETDSNAAGSSYGNFPFDYQNGWISHSSYNVYQSWMWKRHAGFDVVAYAGDEVASNDRVIRHSLGKIPEMIWVKNRTIDYSWDVYHKGMNGGTNPWNYGMHLNDTSVESADSSVWNNTAPTSLGFTVGSSHTVNRDGSNFLAMLFASVEGISKVGYFAGSDSANTISLGFTPRFFLLKNVNATEYWPTHDSVRGFDKRLAINNANPQATTTGWVTPTASGVTLKGNELAINKSGYNYIYYAHA